MKKLNRKGFTLIELLAVIVILAIIVVVTVPTIISTISDARVSSIWNLASETANSYNVGAAQDLLSPGKTLKGAIATTSWQCLAKVSNVDSTKGTVNLAEIFDLSTNDLILDGTVPTDTDLAKTDYKPAQTVCSAIKVTSSGSAVVFLNAKDAGKFAVAIKAVYALSSEDAGHQN